jgi:thiamine kinase-like enzyme
VAAEPLGGGITNTNFIVHDSGRDFVARIGDDSPVHGIARANELAAERAAHAAGIAPEIVYWEPGALVMRRIDGRTLAPEDVREPRMFARIIDVIRTCHREVPTHFRGATPMFWVFQVLRDYAHTLRERNSHRTSALPHWLGIAAELERVVGPTRIVFGHNDLLAANFIDDGGRLWLIDWEYAGFNSPLFDLGGLASNNGLSPAQEESLLEQYFEEPITDALRRRYAAMRCASLLREAMWSMVSEIQSTLDFDYGAYTDENLRRFEGSWAEFQNRWGA